MKRREKAARQPKRAAPPSQLQMQLMSTSGKQTERFVSKSPTLSPPNHMCVNEREVRQAGHLQWVALITFRGRASASQTRSGSVPHEQSATFQPVRFRTLGKDYRHFHGRCHEHERTLTFKWLLWAEKQRLAHRVLFAARCEHDVLFKSAAIGGTRLFHACFTSIVFWWWWWRRRRPWR